MASDNLATLLGSKNESDSSESNVEEQRDFGRRCAKIVRAHRLFPANFAFRCFAKYNFKDVKFSAL